MTTYPSCLEESIYLSTCLCRRGWPPSYLSRRTWPPLPSYLRGDGHLSTHFGAVYLLIYLPIWEEMATHLPIQEKMATHLHIWEEMATHLPIQEEMATSTHLFKRGWSLIFWSSLSIYLLTYLSTRKRPPTYISKRRWPPTYQSRRRWPPRPTYLGWDGHLSIYLGHPITHLGGDGTYLLTYLSRRRWLPTYISRRRWPPTYLSRGRWPLI